MLKMIKPKKCPACGSTRVSWNYDMRAKGTYRFKCLNCGYTWDGSVLREERQETFKSASRWGRNGA